MAKNAFVKPKPADLSLRPLGHARENKAAEDYTGFKYPAGGSDKDINVYKQPMTVPVDNEITKRDFTNKKSAYDVSVRDPAMTVSVGYDDVVDARGKGTMRGFGAATKGHKISGKMG